MPEKPAVYSLLIEGAVVISWNPDPAADSYRLYREAGAGDVLHLVYAGTACETVDTVPLLDRLYTYRLSKIRGAMEFGPSEPVPGVASSVAVDGHRNDSRAQALLVDYVTPATIHYYRDDRGNEIEDRDWYRMIVPPRSFVTLAVDNLTNTSTVELLFQTEGETAAPLSVAPAGERTLYNYTLEPATVSFQICVAKDDFVGVTGQPGGKVAGYHVRFVQCNSL